MAGTKKNPPAFWAELEPREDETRVGQVALQVRELSMARWEDFVKLLADVLSAEGLLTPFAELVNAYRQKEQDGQITTTGLFGLLFGDLESVGSILRNILEKVLGEELPAVGTIALRNSENVRRLLDAELIVVESGDDGLLELDAFVRENLTPRQLAHVIDMAIEVNDPSDVLGKFRALSGKISGLLGLGASENPTEPEEAAAPVH